MLNVNIRKEEMSEINAVNLQPQESSKRTANKKYPKQKKEYYKDKEQKPTKQKTGKNTEYRAASYNSEHSVKFGFQIKYIFKYVTNIIWNIIMHAKYSLSDFKFNWVLVFLFVKSDNLNIKINNTKSVF